jgi:hypothetical protein
MATLGHTDFTPLVRLEVRRRCVLSPYRVRMQVLLGPSATFFWQE